MLHCANNNSGHSPLNKRQSFVTLGFIKLLVFCKQFIIFMVSITVCRISLILFVWATVLIIFHRLDFITFIFIVI